MAPSTAAQRRARHQPAFTHRPAPVGLHAQVRYLLVLLRRFRLTLALLALALLGGTTLLHAFYVGDDGAHLGWPQAAQGIYFLMIGNPTLPFPRLWFLQALYFAVPPLGVIGVADGVIRLAYLFFARQRQDKEWIEVLAQTMQGHVVLCGAGRVGYRIYQALKVLGVPILVVERREDAAFVGALRAEGAAVLIEDAATAGTLARVNLAEARAVVCATDDDLANVNIALDARRLKPGIRVVMRLFDDDLATKVEGAFSVDAFSTSALAAPSFAAAALDPGVLHSFWLAGELHVVAELTVGATLAGRSVESLRAEQLLVALLERGGARLSCPAGTELLRAGDQVHLQGPFRAYAALERQVGPTPG